MQLPSAMLSVLLASLVLALSLSAQAKFIDRLSYDDLSSVVGPTPALLFFTVNWCAHCKEIQPEIAVLAKAVKNNPQLTVARIDGDEEPGIMAKLHVHSFPTILYTPSGFNLKEEKEPEEFTDYRWAELMAEFVNNETQSEMVKLEPRQKFLNWRKKVPYNKGKKPRVRLELAATPTPHPEGLDPIHGAEEAGITIRDPIVLNDNNFDDVVIKNETESLAVYFYTRDDPMQREFLIQWRQAASAFMPSDHVSLAMMNIEKGDNAEIAKRYGIDDTPKVLYFPRCNTEPSKKEGYECKKPNSCGEGCEDTDAIINFVSDQMMLEMGVDPNSPPSASDGVVTLTEEEYQRMIKEGKITPWDGSEGEVTEDHTNVAHEELAINATEADASGLEREETVSNADSGVELEAKTEL